MLYYKVPKKLDGHQPYSRKKQRHTTTLVANELLTNRECDALDVPTGWLEPVEVSRKKIYFFFGARFELKND